MSAQLIHFGLDHHRAPLRVREAFARNLNDDQGTFQKLKALGAEEAFVLSTCNRVEVLCVGDDRTEHQVLDFINACAEGHRSYISVLHNQDARHHLYRVAASLESVVVGEPQILGQFKDAYRSAKVHQSIGPELDPLLQDVIRVGKKVREETPIGRLAVSTSFAGVELARKIFGGLDGLSCLLIGAGEMGALAAEHFAHRGAKLSVVNRTYERSIQLAERYSAQALRFEDLHSHLVDADVILSSTAAPGYIVSFSEMQDVMRARRNRMLLCVDIAVPRDIDPKCSELDNLFCYDVDDLSQVVDENKEARRQAALEAGRIVEKEVSNYHKRLSSKQIGGGLRDFRTYFSNAVSKVLDEIIEEHRGELSDALVARMRGGLRQKTQKCLHHPTTALKRIVEENPAGGALLAEAFDEMFGEHRVVGHDAEVIDLAGHQRRDHG